MPLENFGSILNFAEEIESQDQAFYEAAASNPACTAFRQLFSALAAESGKNVLEPIRDFVRAPFCEACEGAGVLGAAEVLETARRLEARALRYYTEAAEKISALPEVARSLKAFGKIRKARQAKLAGL
jgi:rubrerythrin